VAVSKETAAAIAAKHPHLAAHAAGAVALDVEVQTANVRGKSVVLGRYRKYRVGGQVVVLDEPEAPVAPPAAVSAEPAKAEPARAAFVAADDFTPVPLSDPAPIARTDAHHHSGGKSKSR
jgi:hypothetical protein